MVLSRKNNSGQAVLIVLLSLSVVLIIVLYIMSRSITDISLSSKEEDSMRAFSAAEAGIERALVIGSDIGNTTIGNANFSASVSDFGSGQNKLVYPFSLKSGEIATFWFSRPNSPTEPVFSGNSVKVCFGTAVTEPPAVEISVFYKTTLGEYQISRLALDSNPNNRVGSNYFSTALTSPCTIDGTAFTYYSNVSLPTSGTLQFMTVKLLYNETVSHKVGIDVSSTGSLLPSQGVKINSDGTSGSSNRSIEVYQLHPVVPSILMNTLFSSSGIVK